MLEFTDLSDEQRVFTLYALRSEVITQDEAKDILFTKPVV